MSEDPFEGSPLSRRDFARLAAATGATLALPGNATASAEHDAFSTEYEYVLTHTPADHAVPTLVRCSDASGPAAVASAVDAEVVTTTVPEPAAYAQLTAAEATTVADLPTAETLSYSPGSNPFWRLGYYPFGVFPETSRAVDFIDYEQMIDGMEQLRAENPDRVTFYSIGQSPGKYNYLTDRDDPKDVWVAEVTNDIDDEAAYREKEKVFYSLSIHGDERAGVEAGCRLAEQLLRGEEPELEAILDDVVLIFCFSNPDGWVARNPQYDAYGVPGAPVHERENASGGDMNRQFPNPGWIDPAHVPGEPDGSDLRDDEPGIDRDVPEYVSEQVPDTLAIVEHFRDYEQLNYGADFHGMYWSSEYILGLASHVQLTNREMHDLYEMNRAIDEQLEAEMDRWTTYADVQEAVTGDANFSLFGGGVLPEQAYDYSPSWEGIGYTGSGYFKDWMSEPERFGCLDMTMMTMEGAYSNLVGGNVYVPELVRMQVLGYQTSMRTIAKFALTEVDATIRTGGESVAYVETDALARSSDELSFLRNDDERTAVERTEATGTLQPEGSTTFAHRIDAGRHSLSVAPHVEDAIARVRVRDPSGDLVREFDPAEQERYVGLPEFTVREPTAGEWTVELASYTGTASAASVQFATVAADGEHPDPLEGLGYRQRSYESDPFVYFEDVDEEADGPFEPVTVGEVADGVLGGYDHAVVVHDEGADDPAYRSALESFVADGGNLVVTDTGTNLLASLDVGDLSAIAEEHVSRQTFYVPHIAEKNDDHPMLSGVRPVQRLLWHIAPLGYSEANEAPMELVDAEAWPGSVVGTTDGQVSAGTLSVGDGSVKYIGSLIRPACQANFHPFGMLNYSVTFFGHLLLTNALGFQQVRRVDGEVVERFGPE